MKANNPDYRRVSPRTPTELRDFIHNLAEKHLPRSSHLAMFEYVFKNGMDQHDKGVRLPKKWNREWEGENKRFQHYIPVKHIDRFNRIADRLEPRPRKNSLLVHILNLGIHFYYLEHDEFGIRRD